VAQLFSLGHKVALGFLLVGLVGVRLSQWDFEMSKFDLVRLIFARADLIVAIKSRAVWI